VHKYRNNRCEDDNCNTINLFNVIAPNPANYQFTLVLEDGAMKSRDYGLHTAD
jgi:hypothetical protein